MESATPMVAGPGRLALTLIATLAPLVAPAQTVTAPTVCYLYPLVQWSAPLDLGEAISDQLPAHVAASENGEAMAIWYGRSAGRLAVQVRRYARVSAWRPTWQPATTLAGLLVGPAWAGPSLSMDTNGNALAAWEQPDAKTGNQRIEVSHFVRAANGSGTWGPRVVLSPATDFARAPVVALRGDGRIGIALWQTVLNGKFALQWARFDAASGVWTSGTGPLELNVDDEIAPSIAFTADGYALLAYQTITGSSPRRVRTYGRWFDAATFTWSAATKLDDTSAASPAAALPPRPRVTLDGDGRGLAAWRHRDGANLQEAVYAADFDSASKAWASSPQALAGGLVPMPGMPAIDASLGASIAPSNARTTFVLWSEHSALGASLYAMRRANASAPWEGKLRVPQPAMVTSIGDAAMAGGSYTSSLWVQHRGTGGTGDYGLYASFYLPGSQGCPAIWTGLQHVANVSRREPRLRSTDRGTVAAATWVQVANDTPRVFASMRASGLGL